MDSLDYDITDPGTRGLLMVQAFNATFNGRDGLMEAYKLAEMERAKRKEAVVQRHSMGLLTGMLAGTDPRELAVNFPLADTGVMSNLVASKVAEDRAMRARQDEEDRARRLADDTNLIADALRKKMRGSTKTTWEEQPTEVEAATPLQPSWMQEQGGPGAGVPPPAQDQQMAMSPVAQLLGIAPPVMSQDPQPPQIWQSPGIDPNQEVAFQPPDAMRTETVPGMRPENVSDDVLLAGLGGRNVDPRAVVPARKLVREEIASRELGEHRASSDDLAWFKTTPAYNKMIEDIRNADENGIPKGEIGLFYRGKLQEAEAAGLPPPSIMDVLDDYALDYGMKKQKGRGLGALKAFVEDPQTANGIEVAADVFIETGKLVGAGRRADVALFVMARAKEKMYEMGLSTSDIVRRMGSFEAGLGALKNTAKIAAQVRTSEELAMTNSGLALEASQKLERTVSPLANEWMQILQRKVSGTPALVDFVTKTNTFLVEYARVMSGAAGVGETPESFLNHAKEMLDYRMNKEGYEAAIMAMRQEMRNRVRSLNHAIERGQLMLTEDGRMDVKAAEDTYLQETEQSDLGGKYHPKKPDVPAPRTTGVETTPKPEPKQWDIYDRYDEFVGDKDKFIYFDGKWQKIVPGQAPVPGARHGKDAKTGKSGWWVDEGGKPRLIVEEDR